MKHDIIVIGGGPSGLLAAATAASRGARTTLLERMDRRSLLAVFGLWVLLFWSLDPTVLITGAFFALLIGAALYPLPSLSHKRDILFLSVVRLILLPAIIIGLLLLLPLAPAARDIALIVATGTVIGLDRQKPRILALRARIGLHRHRVVAGDLAQLGRQIGLVMDGSLGHEWQPMPHHGPGEVAGRPFTPGRQGRRRGRRGGRR